jgi:hypothetical protein
VSIFNVGDHVIASCGCHNGQVGRVEKVHPNEYYKVNLNGVIVDISGTQIIREDKMNQVKDDDVVTATAGRIRSAAGKCPQANQVLREVYPEVFKEEVKFQVGDIVEYCGTSHENLQGEHGIVVEADDRACIRVSFWKSGCLRYYILQMALKLILRPNLTCTPKA